MISSSIYPYISSSVVSALVSLHATKLARDYLDKMRAHNLQLKPDRYLPLITSLVEQGDVNGVTEFLAEMDERHLPVSLFLCYNPSPPKFLIVGDPV